MSGSDKLEKLPLWKRFAKEADDDQRTMVRGLVKHASNLLTLVRDTFPTYTLHNHIHSENVVRLMGELLGDDIEKITALEGAILILSAYYHDIGMVFREEERNDLTGEEDFDKFKKEHSEAIIKISESNDEIPPDVAEWYCRWIHPDRVHFFLNEIDNEEIKWGVVSLKRSLGNICRSHGYDIDGLLDEKTFKTDFLSGGADLRFCAILLRLADIVDFDNTRSPEEIYDYLGLKQRKDKRQEMGDVEWLKHLCTEGFGFTGKRNEPYTLGFIAAPDDPAVEYDVRQFLDTIESELNKCQRMLSKCSDRWQSFSLPYKIDRTDIHSDGYKYGEYRFTLEQNQVLELFTGENLYDNPYVFVRELLQNAIDTARHRQFFEENGGNADYEPKVVVSHWRDQDGYQWIRFDDNGMGMDEDKIIKYLLKVGRSYYASADFQADKLGYKRQDARDFTPISRFGIGLLSCFIAGDRIEINTRPVQGDSATRLSLPSLRGFYILQSEEEGHSSNPMPEQYENESGYRKGPGTSIAVRLDPRKEGERFTLRELLERYVSCSPVPIESDGELVGGEPGVILEKPWLDKIVSAELNDSVVESIEETLEYKFPQPPRIIIVPLNLTKYSPSPDLKGQILMISLEFPDEYPFRETFGTGPVCLYTRQDGIPEIWASKPGPSEPSITVPIQDALHELLTAAEDFVQPLFDMKAKWISHNGIVVPTALPVDDSEDLSFAPRYFALMKYGFNHYLILGVLSLTDFLRPDVSLARDQLRGLSWNTYSTIMLALLRSANSYQQEDIEVEVPKSNRLLLGSRELLLDTILKDPYMGIDGEWALETIIQTDQGKMSLRGIRENLEKGMSFEIKDVILGTHISSYFSSFMDYCGVALVQVGLKLKLIVGPRNKNYKYVVNTPGDPIISNGQKLFLPLFFAPYEDSDLLQVSYYAPLNQNHPFSKWLIEKARTLNRKFPGRLQFIKDRISEDSPLKDSKDEINEILERLRSLDEDIRPPKNIDLKDSDFPE
ncbi:hypothetical protein ACFL6S_05765 [Candidatus Poribacteria bacterium]